jgi:uncharacterized coiled-coil protein SlyX
MANSASAWDKLEQAVTRLENALETASPSAGDSADVEVLEKRIHDLESQNQTLNDLNKTAARQLDSAIDRLRAVLDD